MRIIRLVELVEEGITNFNDVFSVLDERNIRPIACENGKVQAYNANTEKFEKMCGKIFGKELSDSGGKMIFVSEKGYGIGITFDMYRCDVIGNI